MKVRDQVIIGAVFAAVVGMTWFQSSMKSRDIGEPCEIGKHVCKGGKGAGCLVPGAGFVAGYCSTECTTSTDCLTGWSCSPINLSSYKDITGNERELRAQTRIQMCTRPGQ
jgi:hypothetical protein